MKILIIEDDTILAHNLSLVLKKEGFAADISETKEIGFVNLEVNEYDCIILDINLPDGNGFELLTALRAGANKTPVIIVTARSLVEDRIKGLNLGADDYVPKPIDSNELIARIRSVIRRNSGHVFPVITVGELTVKPAEHYAAIGSNSLDVTTKELAVLEYMAQHSGQVITRTMIMEHVWGSDFDTFSNVIDVYIRNLRRKIGVHTNFNYIKTIRGKGYILENHAK